MKKEKEFAFDRLKEILNYIESSVDEKNLRLVAIAFVIYTAEELFGKINLEDIKTVKE